MEMSLYRVTKELVESLNELVEREGELLDGEEEKIKDLKNSLVQKTDNVVGWVQYNKDLVNLAKERIEELKEFIERKELSLERFDAYVNTCLENLCTNKIEGELSSITKRKPTMIVEVYDESALPVQYVRVPEVKPSIDKIQLAKDLKNGVEIEGARLVESKNISINYKLK